MKVLINDDFDLQKITASGQCFRAVKSCDDWYRFITGCHVLYIRKTAVSEYESNCTEKEWDTVWRRYFNLGKKYASIRESIPENDSFLRKAAEYGQGIRILRQEPFETLLSFIISQRKNIPAIRKCVEELAQSYGTPVKTERETVFAFPKAEQLAHLTEKDLRERMLGYRAPYVLDAIQKSAAGELTLQNLQKLGDEELLEQLLKVKGVGSKVAKCVALFAYGRTAFSPVDTWIRQIIEQNYNGRDPFPVYRENAGILQQYAFLYAIDHKKEFG